MSVAPEYDLNIQLNIAVEPEAAPPLRRIETAVTWLLRRHEIESGAGISVVITGDEAVRELNQQFRGVDAPTDVLSFPADPLPIPDEPLYLGDLVLALPTIERQAAAEQHAVADELLLAVIHGTLHLLGYDHDTAEHQAAMWAVQAEALQVMNIQIVVPIHDFSDEIDFSDEVDEVDSD